MNQIILDNLGLLIVLFMITVLLLFAGIILVAFLVLKKNKDRKLDTTEKKSYDEIKKELATQATYNTGHCFTHKDQPSRATCAICEQEICEQCIRQINNINFCPEHISTYVSNNWTPITNQRTTPDNPEDGIYIYDFKKDIWLQENVPSYIQTEYKINMDNDFIESFVQLHVREEDVDSLKAKVNKGKKYESH
jgi:hypothetical protein